MRHRAVEFLAPFLTFFGWGVLAWGLILPWSPFAQCHGLCAPAFPLDGVPYELVISGIAAFAIGATLFGLLVVRRTSRARLLEGETRERDGKAT